MYIFRTVKLPHSVLTSLNEYMSGILTTWGKACVPFSTDKANLEQN